MTWTWYYGFLGYVFVSIVIYTTNSYAVQPRGFNMSKLAQRRGFTLLEIMVAILIIGILLAVGGPIYTSYTVKSRFAEVFANIGQAKTDLQAAYYDNDEFPTSFGNYTVATYNAVSSPVIQQVYYGVSTDSQDAYLQFYTQDLGVDGYVEADTSGNNGVNCRVSVVAMTTSTGNTQFYCGQWDGSDADVPLTNLPTSCQDLNLSALIS